MSGIKNGTEVTLSFSSNVVGISNDETNVPRKLSLTNTQASRICKIFAKGSSANIKFSKTQLERFTIFPSFKGFISQFIFQGAC